jgi:hypothetical protein
MHCGAEVTESSTNKQHHLSSGDSRIMISSDSNPLVDGRGGRGAHVDPLDG